MKTKEILKRIDDLENHISILKNNVWNLSPYSMDKFKFISAEIIYEKEYHEFKHIDDNPTEENKKTKIIKTEILIEQVTAEDINNILEFLSKKYQAKLEKYILELKNKLGIDYNTLKEESKK